MRPEVYREQIAAALAAFEVRSWSAYAWLGLRTTVSAPRGSGSASARARLRLQLALRHRLYADFYCTGGPIRRPPMADRGILRASPFLTSLVRANCGNGRWSAGWEVRAVDGHRALVRKGGLRVWVPLGDCRAPADALLAGDVVAVRSSKGDAAASPGFYVAFGNHAADGDPARRTARLYWNLTADGAVRFMRGATSALNRAAIPFQLKALQDPDQYARCDAVVLYLPALQYEIAVPILARLHRSLQDDVKLAIPAFTKRVAKGVGVADDPPDGSSFGFDRCGMLAEGAVRAFETRRRSAGERFDAVAACFADHGIDVDAPYLNAGGADRYHAWHPVAARSAPRKPRLGAIAPRALLQAAVDIGRSLDRAALRDGGRCSWLAAVPSRTGDGTTSYRSLDAGLYAGTAGLALFFAELYAATGERFALRAARGSMRHALSRRDAVLPRARAGLFTGWIGIALAAARVAELCRDEGIHDAARDLVRGAARTTNPEFDVINGTAGAVIGLAALREAMPSDGVVEFATKLGDGLIERTTRCKADDAWEWRTSSRGPALTGLSHGAAGVGLAFVELFAATGELRFRNAAEGAFRYERKHFDSARQNWPDFRDRTFRSLVTTPAAFGTTWCHGAPGIALSRLRASHVLGDGPWRSEAIVALDTTCEITESLLKAGTGNFSLCHGLAGNAEVAAIGRTMLGGSWTRGTGVVRAVAAKGIAAYAQRGRRWPCGTPHPHPGLMQGLAGIGLFYLRMADASIPGILAPTMCREPSGNPRGRRYAHGVAGTGAVTPTSGGPPCRIPQGATPSAASR